METIKEQTLQRLIDYYYYKKLDINTVKMLIKKYKMGDAMLEEFLTRVKEIEDAQPNRKTT